MPSCQRKWQMDRVGSRWKMLRVEGQAIAVREPTWPEKLRYFHKYLVRPNVTSSLNT